MNTRRIAALAALAPLAALAAATPLSQVGVAAALPVVPPGPPAQIVNIESDVQLDDTTTPGGNVVFARTSPTEAGAGFGWWLRIDVRIKNTGLVPITVTSFTLDTDETAPVEIPLDSPVNINVGKSASILVPSGLAESDDDGPSSLTVLAYLQGYAQPVIGAATLVAYESPTRSDGVRFPARGNDLPIGSYWYAGAHAHNTSQRYAYDFGGRRWDSVANAWTSKTAVATAAAANGGPVLGTQNSHYIIFNTPVYAVASATIVRCRRSAADNVPGESVPGGGNTIILDLGDGTFVAYYHLKQFSVPAALCPMEGADGDDQTPISIPVVAGQFLGRVGNSGHSGGPHLHLHLTDSADPGSSTQRGLPLRFTGIQTHGYSGYNPEVDASAWYAHGPSESGVPVNSVISPPCGGPACALAPG